MRNLCIVLSISFAFLACATPEKATMPADDGPVLNISKPPSGSLSTDQLKAIAENIHRLEARPLASDADIARDNLFVWLTGSPDVSVKICPGMLGDFDDSKEFSRGLALIHFLLSSAATRIELKQDVEIDVYLGGMKGAIASYQQVLGQKGGKARSAFMDSMIEKDLNGGLEDFIRSALSNC